MANVSEGDGAADAQRQQPAPPPAYRPLPSLSKLHVSTKDLQLKIDEVLAPLYELQVDRTQFTVTNINNMFLLTTQFLKGSRVLMNPQTSRDLASLLDVCIRAGLLQSVKEMTVESFWKCVKYFRTPQGRQEMEHIAWVKKIEARRVGVQTTQDVALIQILTLQIADMSQDVKAMRAALEAEIADRMRQVEKKTEEVDAAINETRRQFLPACEWAEPSETFLNNRCWELYVQACFENDIDLPPKDYSSITRARNTYSQIVIVELKTAFCSFPARRRLLINYLQQKIQYLHEVCEFKQERTFCRYLVVLGVPKTPPTTQEGGRGEADEAGDYDKEKAIVQPVAQPATARKGDARCLGKRPVEESDGVLRKRRSRGGRHSEVTGSQAARGGETAGDSGGQEQD